MVSLPTILLILAAVSIGATVIAAIIAFRSAREARSAIFPIVREEETVRAQRARIATFLSSALTALFLGGWLATLRLFPLGEPAQVANTQPIQPAETAVIAFVTETPTPVTEPLATATPLAEMPQAPAEAATNTPLPAAIPSPVSSPAPTFESAAVPAGVETSPTEPPAPTPFLPTATLLPPTATPMPPLATPLATPIAIPPTETPTLVAIGAQIPTAAPRTPAPAGAKMGPIQFAADITPSIEAINPGDLFPQGTEAVYAVYPYTGMIDGLDFTAVWYQNGAELWRDEQKWRWGNKAQFYSFLNPPGEGLYKLELYINDSVVATGLFEIR